MTVRWQETVRAAERAQFEATPVGRLLAWLGISSYWFQRAHFARKAVIWLAWTLLFRKVKIVAGSIAAVWLLFVLAVVALLVLAIAQLT
jgi:hypothetical protein